MLSVIVCSRKKDLDENFVKNIQNTIGVSYEIINIDNSENKYSIFKAYNQGYKRSTKAYLCFVHDDVIFHSENWGARVIEHLQDTQTGIIGVAGGDLVPRVPSSWSTLISPSHNIIESHKKRKSELDITIKPKDYNKSKRSTITLDGVFMCMRRGLMNEIKFDESLKGFHCYDYDITLQSVVAGYKNYVMYDIKLEHFSGGKTNIEYFRNLISVFKKWEKYLPLIGQNITDDERKNIYEIEKRKLHQLTKKMVRKGFDSHEIKTEICYFAQLIGYKKAARCLKFRIFLMRLFNAPKYLIK
jgi:GT2 family glycosyltransferase